MTCEAEGCTNKTERQPGYKKRKTRGREYRRFCSRSCAYRSRPIGLTCRRGHEKVFDKVVETAHGERPRYVCKVCRTATRRARLYGITLDEALALEVPEHCEICGVEGELYADHNHQTGKLRGFLCQGCNSGLGYFKENVEAMQSAISYLKARGYR